jgi:hypothetical protein
MTPVPPLGLLLAVLPPLLLLLAWAIHHSSPAEREWRRRERRLHERRLR